MIAYCFPSCRCVRTSLDVCSNRGLHTCWYSLHQELIINSTWLQINLLNPMLAVSGYVVLHAGFSLLFGFIFAVHRLAQRKKDICCSTKIWPKLNLTEINQTKAACPSVVMVGFLASNKPFAPLNM